MNLYERTCKTFIDFDVEFVIIGGFAVNYWGYNRSTGDLDFYINSDSKNLNNLFGALDQLGFLIDDEARTVINSGDLIQFSEDHHTVELLFKINLERSFEEAYGSAIKSNFGNIEVPFIDFDDLILEKLKSKKPKDLHDVHELKNLRDN